MEHCHTLYSALWDTYFLENPELGEFIKGFNGFSDVFGQSGHACQAREVYRIWLELKKPPLSDTRARLAIIGTAGRGRDQTILEYDHYRKMVDAVHALVDRKLRLKFENLELVSGGAAWSDHLVVTLVVNKVVKPSQVHLYLPAVLTADGFTGDGEWAARIAGVANHYHSKFSEQLKDNSIAQLNQVIADGAHCEVITSGFKTRNSKVAKFAGESNGHLLAFTFGSEMSYQPEWTLRTFSPDTKADDAGLKDGGTADTWTKAKCTKHHCRLGIIPYIPSH